MAKFENPNSGGQTKVEQIRDGIRVTFQPKLVLFPAIFLAGWLVAWYFGLTTVTTQIMSPKSGANGPNLFLIGWLIAWAAGGAMAMYRLFWSIAGKEVVNISNDDFQITKSIAGIPFSRRNFRLSDVKLLKVDDQPVTNRGFQTDVYCVTLRYGVKTVTFFKGIGQYEGRDVCDQLSRSNVWLGAGQNQIAT